ncbi:MFS transporter [Ralstonia mannitolilytica]|uniref:Inner membrane protein ybjJ n=1 Tax=Ralstonia mannitolilytica TaxID=105219 RepID=A0AAJ4ZJ43_9RALS|nr:MFS transporter [Ralstonia mannitolilytica]CAG2142328.1 Inner membrane protein YbjJ [Ralstonia mannitolilytica]CAJ0730997.1 Inner membrane protein YbjJ [Ralstonia mannitolilytica]SUD86900.1 Inner membrane protein ybjJ [Ralstonia mannitolilytica]SUD92823.1 Inner membrane protein ybjJ [Ralstonia mannitolilytica]SUD96561.1 Inner membrane protein ybjJ [Ralstonia mannitolilytica]
MSSELVQRAGVVSPRRLPLSARAATMALFFVNGATFATWGIHIPTVKARFGLSEASLSLAMFMVAAGAIVAMKFAGSWAARIGTRRASVQAGMAFGVMTALIMLMPTYPTLLAVLLLFGITNAGFDVAMNAQAATVEANHHKPIISSLHGMFSLGGMAGAAAGGVLLELGVPPAVHCGGMALVTMATALCAGPFMLPDHVHAEGEPAHPTTGRTLFVLGLLAFFGLVGEGAMYDWTTVYMREIAQSPEAIASAGYAAFSGGMALARFGGDVARGHWGNMRVLRASGVLATAGILLALLWPAPAAVLAGFGLMGVGAANMVPIFFITASRLPGVPAAEGIAAVARFAYVGLLVGPVIIGLIAHRSDLRWGLSVVALTMALIAVAGPHAIRRPEHR